MPQRFPVKMRMRLIAPRNALSHAMRAPVDAHCMKEP